MNFLESKIKQWLLIGVALISAFFVSSILIHIVFIDSSPKVRPHMVQYIAEQSKDFFNPVSTLIAKLTGKGIIQTTEQSVEEHKKEVEKEYLVLEQAVFKPLSKGVAAREHNNISETRYELNNVKWVEYGYTTKSGKVIKIKVAEGQNPPPPGILE